jgi:uncharacterized glyoxalase superfamily protein PhnB
VLFLFSVVIKIILRVLSRSKSEGSGIVLWLETDDVEGGVSKAVSAGGVAVGEIAEGEGGERVGKVKDPYGLVWSICSPPKKCIDVDA